MTRASRPFVDVERRLTEGKHNSPVAYVLTDVSDDIPIEIEIQRFDFM